MSKVQRCTLIRHSVLYPARAGANRQQAIAALSKTYFGSEKRFASAEKNATIYSVVTKKTEPSKRSRGRPPIQEGERVVTLSFKLTEAQREKLRKLGGPSWIRNRIDKARIDE